MRPGVLLGAALLLACADPAAAQSRRCDPPVEPHRPTSGAQAVRAEQRAAALDTLRQVLLAATRDGGVENPAGMVILELSPRRTIASVRRIDTDVPEPLVRAAFAPHAALLARIPRGEDAVHFRLDEVDLPATAGLECAPSIRNPHEFQRAFHRLQPEDLEALSRDRRPAVVRMLVDRDGAVVHAYMVSQTRIPARAELDLVGAGYRLRFDPATVAGVPVDVWVELPITVFPGRR